METITCSGVNVFNGVSEYWGSRYQLNRTDAGRGDSRRSKQSNDCTVMALANVADVPYDEAYDLLADRGRKCGRGGDFPSNRKNDTALGLTFIWHSFPAIKAERRMNIGDFCEAHPKGKFIARVAKHVFAVIDGVVHDSFNQSPARCVYGCWEVTTEIVE